MKKPDIIAALDMVVGCFEELGIAYYIGGSVASSAYGIARATMDVDLVADIKTRAKRRLQDLKGDQDVTLDDLIKSIQDRDDKDSRRSVGPLKPAEDAIIIDTENLTLEQVVDKIYTRAVNL